MFVIAGALAIVQGVSITPNVQSAMHEIYQITHFVLAAILFLTAVVAFKR